MPRPFTGEAGLAAASERAEFVHLIELEFSGGVVRLNTGAHDLVTEPYAVRFPASTSQYMICNPVATWPTTELTIEWWGRVDVGATGLKVPFSYDVSGVTNAIFAGIFFNSSPDPALTIAIDDAGGAPSAAYPEDGEEHHVVITWKSAGGVVAIYLDGALVASGSGYKTGYSIPGGGAAVLGQEQDSLGGGFDAAQAWLGELDDVRVYRRALTAAEAEEHYRRVFVNEQKLVGHWSFDQWASVAANLGRDSSPVGNHMTVVGITAPVEGFPQVRRAWEAVGGLLEFGGVEETSDVKGQGVDLRLSGVDQSILAVLQTNNFRGYPARVYRAHLDTTLGTIVPSIIPLFQGRQLNPYTVDQSLNRGGGTVRISTRVASMLGLERRRGLLANLASHQRHYPGDLGMQHVASLVNRMIYWGTNAPMQFNPAAFRPGYPYGGRTR